MNYDYLYFKDEVREGFYVSGFMKRFWAAQMEVLEDFSNICKELNIRWYAAYGSLLGAVRHKGFIPWDDDIDIFMFRKDYDYFMEKAVKKLPQYMFKNNFIENGNFMILTRMFNSDKLSLDKERLNKFHNMPLSVGIDIFVLDGISDNEELENKRNELLKQVFFLAEQTCNDKLFDICNYENSAIVNEIENNTGIKLRKNDNLQQKFLNIIDLLQKKFSYEYTSKVAVVFEHVLKNEKAFNLDSFDKIIELPFEKITVNCPYDYDSVLKSIYGDYIKAVRTGGDHNYPGYSINRQIYLNAFEEKSPFNFDFSDIKENESRNNFNMILSLIEKYVLLLKSKLLKVEFLENELKNELENNKLAESEFIVLAQNMAINLGQKTESILGEENAIVIILEEICESLYKLYETQNANGESALFANELSKSINKLEKYLIERKEKRKIVFIVSFPDEWKYFEKEYNKKLADLNNELKLIVVPHYERLANGALGARHYLIEEFKTIVNVVNVVDYTEYDLRKEHPDIIYTQNAFDNCNYTICLEPAYMTCQLKQYTNELIYVPAFVTDEIIDDKMYKMLDEYVCIPGIYNADRIIVQSEKIKKIYIKKLSENKKIPINWDKKIESE